MDRPDEFDVPSAPDGGGADGPSRSAAGRRVAVEERDRFEYYDALRLAERDSDRGASAETSRAEPGAESRAEPSPESRVEPGAESCAESSTESRAEPGAESRAEARAEPRAEPGEGWAEAAERFRLRWADHLERWPDGDREPVDRSSDPEGSWRGDSGRFLDRAANAEVEERYGKIAEAERTVLTPAMREIEACDPERRLVGFEHRLKGLDRLKDKVAVDVEEKGRTATEALALMPDAVRYTFRYGEGRYAEGVDADMRSIQAGGFELVKLKNYWACDQYRGINTQWLDRQSGMRFEVQFHTEASFEAKQLTHRAYERLRSGVTEEEEGELEGLQHGTVRMVPQPRDNDRIKNYP